MLTTSFTRLTGCSVPIQLAGMTDVAGPKLTAAVSNAGAYGMLGVVLMDPDQMAEAIAQTRTLTTAKFGVNMLMPFVNPDCVALAGQLADLVEFFYGTPDPALIEAAHQGGALVSWQTGSLEEAKAAVDAGCDVVVAQGVEAGGHVRGCAPLLRLLDEVLGEVEKPVVAAGGIGSPRTMAAALAAGASAVRVGTRFLAAAETNAHPDYVHALIRSNADDTVITEAYGVMWPDAPHRVLRSAIEAAKNHPGETVGEMEFPDGRHPLPKWHVAPPDAGTTGNIAAMALYAGESVSHVREVQPAAAIVEELAGGAEHLLRHWTSTDDFDEAISRTQIG